MSQLYAYFKQAQQDPSIDKAPAPGTFDLKVSLHHEANTCFLYSLAHYDQTVNIAALLIALQADIATFLLLYTLESPHTDPPQGKAKKKAWQKIVDEGVSPSQAEQKYVTLVNELKDKYGYDPNKSPEAVGA